MPNSRKTTIGNDAQDLIGAEIGEAARNITVGKDNAHATADVNIALSRVADMSERELNQVSQLVKEVSALRSDVNTLVRELVGNQQYGSIGALQRLSGVEDRQMMNRIAMGLFAVSEAVQWLLLIYWLVTR